MEKNEIKKKLYKQNPNAKFLFMKNGIAYYYADLPEERIRFQIPFSDMGEGEFGRNMDSKYLIRWIVS